MYMKKSKNKQLQLTKMDVAKRHFIEAEILFFEGRDPVAIHHLIHAAHEILAKITGKNMLLDTSLFTDEGKKVVCRAFVKSKNFMKHADNDPDSVLEFNPDLNIVLLLDCAVMLANKLGVDFFPAQAYMAWCATTEPSLFLEDYLG